MSDSNKLETGEEQPLPESQQGDRATTTEESKEDNQAAESEKEQAETDENGEEATPGEGEEPGETADGTGGSTHREIAPAGARPLVLEPYIRQKPKWPRDGKHILAQFDQDSVVVYQAFKAEIAEYAVENQQLGGPHFSFTRMSWIKTNFLWMMYRCGWATKANQEHVLAIRITREGFDEILANAYTAKCEKMQIEPPETVVRLQWDPDHGPNGANERRRAIQLGLKKELLQKYANEFIVSIEDITEMVNEQHHHATKGSIVKLRTPRERVYHVEDEVVARRIDVDTWEEDEESEDDL